MRFYTNENFPLPTVRALQALGHDVLTTLDAGKSGQGIPDEEVLRFATIKKRVILTLNRRDFINLHYVSNAHYGILVCYEDLNFSRLAQRVHDEISGLQSIARQLIQLPQQVRERRPRGRRR